MLPQLADLRSHPQHLQAGMPHVARFNKSEYLLAVVEILLTFDSMLLALCNPGPPRTPQTPKQ
eukprot:5060256-Amphidinium_carterae.1